MTLTPEEEALWLNGLRQMDAGNRVILCCIFAAFGLPLSYLDVGSGTGAMVNAAAGLGIDAVGLDQMAPPNTPRFFRCDLRHNQNLGRTFDLVTSIEVAEHLEEEYAEEFVDNIARHVAKPGRIVFTAAMPGQKGKDHYNCQPAKYWRDKFFYRQIAYSAEETWRLCAMLATAQHGMHHVEANLQVFHT